eukprot:CAMPEP_0185800288 /NCGR_PEP_ID=MMETSP1322-20130828/805_1 /TAXON_ID=265543 /ORGANISM="Minutocellus polymorphus, Strain RCC2270" /LENGTH=105 /DNA_ID=CAMNT_0028495929 /DNA_START=33 /DNA_END=350 /DNA_ORIENTATION=+
MASPPNYEEVNSYFRQRMEESRKIWSTRGRDGQIAAAAARKGTWRQLSGVPLMMHEIKHVGNRPFAWGFATVALATVYISASFSDEAKASSNYWSTFHGTGEKKH